MKLSLNLSMLMVSLWPPRCAWIWVHYHGKKTHVTNRLAWTKCLTAEGHTVITVPRDTHTDADDYLAPPPPSPSVVDSIQVALQRITAYVLGAE